MTSRARSKASTNRPKKKGKKVQNQRSKTISNLLLISILIQGNAIKLRFSFFFFFCCGIPVDAASMTTMALYNRLHQLPNGAKPRRINKIKQNVGAPKIKIQHCIVYPQYCVWIVTLRRNATWFGGDLQHTQLLISHRKKETYLGSERDSNPDQPHGCTDCYPLS